MSQLIKTLKSLRCPSLSKQRLAADIEDFETAFARYQIDAAKGGIDHAWVEGCKTQVANAKRALERCDVASGYQSLLNAEREAVPLMPADEIQARVISLRNEVTAKLAGSWRGDSASLLLEGKPEEVSAEAIREAMFHRNTHSQNIYRKIELLRRQLTFIGGLLVALLLIAIVVGASGGLAALEQKDPAIGSLLTFAIYMGVLGGTLSAAISVSHTDTRAKIPDVQRTRLVTLARSALGGTAAVAVFLLIQGNVVNVMTASTTPWGVLFFCFLAGFSERWFLSTLNTFTKEKGTCDKQKKG